MHRVIVIGSVNHDRIWHLEGPLIAGSRLRVSARDMQIGGGGFFTGSQLRHLGADIALVSRLARDTHGLSALKLLQDMGFDIAGVQMLEGETQPLDILLEPNGERTIIAPSSGSARPFSVVAPLRGDAAYVNAFLLDEQLVAGLEKIPLVVSQFPIRAMTPRPADYVITSRSDAGDDVAAAWERARTVAGPRLKMLVVTHGKRPITLFDGRATIEVGAPPPVEVKSTIGAGDSFAGAFVFALLEGKGAAEAAAEAGRQTSEWLRRREGAGKP